MEFIVPEWVATLLPLIVLGVTFLVNKIPAIAAFGPRNLSAVVAIVITAIVVVLNPPALPSGEIMSVIEGFIALMLWAWKGAQTVYDALTGQLMTPSGHYRAATFGN